MSSAAELELIEGGCKNANDGKIRRPRQAVGARVFSIIKPLLREKTLHLVGFVCFEKKIETFCTGKKIHDVQKLKPAAFERHQLNCSNSDIWFKFCIVHE